MHVSIEPISTQLARARRPREAWLWCFHCSRFFQVKHLQWQGTSNERCPFPECGAWGLDFDIFAWNAHREPDDPRWPRSEDELEYGMRSPDMSSFYEERERRERAALVAMFERSPEYARLGRAGSVGPHWTNEMLEKLSWWGADPCLLDPILLGETLYDFGYWVECEPVDAHPIVEELQAFFSFAGRELGFEYGHDCAYYLSEPELPGDLAVAIGEHTDLRVKSVAKMRRVFTAEPSGCPADGHKPPRTHRRSRGRK
jgi:hypothetical protein